MEEHSQHQQDDNHQQQVGLVVTEEAVDSSLHLEKAGNTLKWWKNGESAVSLDSFEKAYIIKEKNAPKLMISYV